jgi:hypothetical protein
MHKSPFSEGESSRQALVHVSPDILSKASYTAGVSVAPSMQSLLGQTESSTVSRPSPPPGDSFGVITPGQWMPPPIPFGERQSQLVEHPGRPSTLLQLWPDLPRMAASNGRGGGTSARPMIRSSSTGQISDRTDPSKQGPGRSGMKPSTTQQSKKGKQPAPTPRSKQPTQVGPPTPRRSTPVTPGASPNRQSATGSSGVSTLGKTPKLPSNKHPTTPTTVTNQ